MKFGRVEAVWAAGTVGISGEEVATQRTHFYTGVSMLTHALQSMRMHCHSQVFQVCPGRAACSSLQAVQKPLCPHPSSQEGAGAPPAFKTLQLMRTDRSETSILALRTGLGVHNQTCRKINLFLGTNNVVIAQSGRARRRWGTSRAWNRVRSIL